MVARGARAPGSRVARPSGAFSEPIGSAGCALGPKKGQQGMAVEVEGQGHRVGPGHRASAGPDRPGHWWEVRAALGGSWAPAQHEEAAENPSFLNSVFLLIFIVE